MSSPGARQRRRRQQYQNPRTRRELTVAIGAGVGIVAGTALMIWLLRPGGIADRQPRSSWLVGLTLLAIIAACYVVLRPRSRLKVSKRLALGGSLGVIAVVAVVVGVMWPKGIIRHTPTLATIPATTSTLPKSTPTTIPKTTPTTAKPAATTTST